MPNLSQAWDLVLQKHLGEQYDQCINKIEDKFNGLNLPAVEGRLMFEVDEIKFETL